MKTIACVVLGWCASAYAAQPTEPSRPNILFVYADDHAAHAVSAYGSVINRTPNIDRLAAEGMLFENCFVTNSICAPARAVVLTGRFGHHNGVLTNAEAFDPSQPTFVPLMREAGYETAVIGKWHLKSDPAGFDHYEVLIDQGPYYNPVLRTPGGDTRHTGYTTDIITDRALAWMAEGRDASKPFVLMYQHKAPHRNWMPDMAHVDLYEDQQIPEPTTLFDDYANRAAGAAETEMTIAGHMFGVYDLKLPVNFEGQSPAWGSDYLNEMNAEQRAEWERAYADRNAAFLREFEAGRLTGDDLTRFKYQRYIKDYLRVIASVDDNLGRVLDYLDESGLAENTIVVYTSDQGFFLGDHGWYDKRWMYEESLRAPLLVRWPGVVDAGSRSSALVQNLDFAQTFLDAGGAEAPPGMQGKSLVPLLRGEADDRRFRDAVYYHYYEYPAPHRVPPHFGLRTDRFKLIRYPTLDAWELFDLADDPDELRSVYEDPAYAVAVEELTVRLERLQREYGDFEPERTAEEIAQRRASLLASTTPTALVYRPGGDTDLDPSMKPLVVGARVETPARGGVVAAHGGGSYGWSLYFEGSTPCLAVRDAGALFVVRGEALEVGRSHHLAGVINRDGGLELWIDGARLFEAAGRFISRKPAEGFEVGRDGGSTVGGYEPPNELVAPVEGLRVYWGSLSARDMQAWAEEASP